VTLSHLHCSALECIALQCVVVRSSVWHCVAVCNNITLQYVAVCCSLLLIRLSDSYKSVLQCVAVCCSVLQCVSVRCSGAVCGSVSQCVVDTCGRHF